MIISIKRVDEISHICLNLIKTWYVLCRGKSFLLNLSTGGTKLSNYDVETRSVECWVVGGGVVY